MFALILFMMMFIVTIVALIVMRVQMEIKIIIKNGKNYSFIIVRFLRGLLRLRINLSVKPRHKGLFSVIFRKTDSSLEEETSAEKALTMLLKMSRVSRRYKEHISYLKTKVHVNSFSVISRVGVGDAAGTALATGGFITIYTMIIHYLQNRYALKKQKMVVLPFFEGSLFDLDLDCIINFKIGHIIITGLRIIAKKLKGGE